jgi:hypothetical protein
MAAKTQKAKTRAKRAAPKAKAKTPRKGPRAKVKPKRKATPVEKRGRQTATAAPARTEPVTPPKADTASTETKRGPLARLAEGVGNLFARMTGKKPDRKPARSPDQTIELAAGDILAMTALPPPIPKPKSRRGSGGDRG